MQPDASHILSLGEVFTIFFVMLGPERLLARFALLTKNFGEKERWRLSFRSAGISILTLIVAGLFGRHLLKEWHIEPIILSLAAGIVFFLTALLPFISKNKEELPVPDKNLNPTKVALNILITPYGIATVVVLVSMSQSKERVLQVLLMLLSVIALDILTMGFGTRIVRFIGLTPLKILGACLKIMVLALALQIIVACLRRLIV